MLYKIFFLLLLFIPSISYSAEENFSDDCSNDSKIIARSGCCSWHSGVCGCSGMRALCCDGTLSPTCGCYNQSLEMNDNLFARNSHYVKPYYRKDGTFVNGHYQTNPDGNIYNNWSTKGNINPYTGKEGTVDPYNFNTTYPSKSKYNSNTFKLNTNTNINSDYDY